MALTDPTLRNRSAKRQLACEETASGFVLRLAPIGVVRAGSGTFWVGIIFLAGVVLLAACFVLISKAGSTQGGVYTPPYPNATVPWQAWVFFSCFGVVSVVITLFGANMGFDAATVEVAGNTLRIDAKSLFSRRHVELRRDGIKAIQSGPSGFSVGGSRRSGRAGAAGIGIQQLHIYLTEGGRIRLFTGRKAEELDLIAAKLRSGLNVGTTRYRGD